MALLFPTNPVANQTFSFSNRTWKWNGFAWDAVIDVSSGSGSGLASLGVSGGDVINNPTDVVVETKTDILNFSVSGIDGSNALLSLNMTGETGTVFNDHTLASNHFSSMIANDRAGSGRKFLTLNDDGTVSFEYIFVPDVFKSSEFSFTIGSFTINGSATARALIGPNTNVFQLNSLDGNDRFQITYPSISTSPASAQITGFSDNQPRDLTDPFTNLITVGLGVTYPSETDQTVTFTVRATGDNGLSDTKTCSIAFPNNVYIGVAGADVSGSNLSSSGLTPVLLLGSQLDSGYSIEVNSGTDQYVWFAYPSRHGQLRSVVDTESNQNKTNEWNIQGGGPQSHTNANGYIEDYYIYRGPNANVGQESLTFST